MADTRMAARMARLVAQWRRSGESAASFARRHGIPTWTFWYWRRKLAAGEPPASVAPGPTFVPVHVARPDAEPVIEIVWTSGERLQIRAEAPTDLVRAAVTALRSTC